MSEQLAKVEVAWAIGLYVAGVACMALVSYGLEFLLR